MSDPGFGSRGIRLSRCAIALLAAFTTWAAGACGGDTSGSDGSVAGSGGTGGSGALPADWFACSDTSECVVREAQCCETCGVALTSQAVAVNRSSLVALSAKLCETHTEPCPVYDCAPMPAFVLPFCLEGRCTALDIREDLLTSCGTSEQCRLRWGTGCCESCGDIPELLVAVNSQVNYDASVCGVQPAACPPCVPPAYPSGARAVCAPDNHCEVIWR